VHAAQDGVATVIGAWIGVVTIEGLAVTKSCLADVAGGANVCIVTVSAVGHAGVCANADDTEVVGAQVAIIRTIGVVERCGATGGRVAGVIGAGIPIVANGRGRVGASTELTSVVARAGVAVVTPGFVEGVLTADCRRAAIVRAHEPIVAVDDGPARAADLLARFAGGAQIAVLTVFSGASSKVSACAIDAEILRAGVCVGGARCSGCRWVCTGTVAADVLAAFVGVFLARC
jgi:hypothetical protein